MANFSIHIPLDPPGINDTYKISSKSGKAEMYKSAEANLWSAQAALLIGAKAGESNWVDDSQHYELSIIFTNWRLDIDAPIKLVVDCLSQKLGFNDNRITKLTIEKNKSIGKGVYLELKPLPTVSLF